MFKKVSILLVLVLLMSALAVGCGGGDTEAPNGDAGDTDTSLTAIQEKGTFIVGCDDAFPPMGFIGDNGEITGFDIELAKLVAEKLGVEAVPQAIDWSAKEMELSSGNIDVIWNGYTIDKERNEKVEFTKPYLNNQQVLVVIAESPYQSKEDLIGKVVGAQVESAGLKALQADEEFSSSLADLPEYDDYLYALLDLETSRLDAVAVDQILIGYTMQQQPGKYRILDEGLVDEYYGIGCPKGGIALREAIDKALDELMEDGSIEALSVEWFGENIVIRDVEKLTAEDF